MVHSTSQDFVQELSQLCAQMDKNLVSRKSYKKLGNMVGNSVFSSYKSCTVLYECQPCSKTSAALQIEIPIVQVESWLENCKKVGCTYSFNLLSPDHHSSV